MGFKEGWQAINMQMPDAVPRTEYSAHVHWELVEKVTGIDTKKNRKPRPRERRVYQKLGFFPSVVREHP